MDGYIEFNNEIDSMYDNHLSYSSGVQVCAHNSFSSVEDGFGIHPQQLVGVAKQFRLGARCFMVDVYEDNGELVLFHKKTLAPLLGIGSSSTKDFYLKDILEDIFNSLHQNKESVATLIIENEETVDSEKVRKALDEIGLGKYLLTKNPNYKEVTFGYMRDNNERLVVFLENGPKAPSKNIYTTAHYKETTYSLEKDQGCIDRGQERALFSDRGVDIFVLNHFYAASCNGGSSGMISAALKKPCSEVNDFHKIIARFNLCIRSGNIPTFIATDFIEQGTNGGLFEAVKYANNFNTVHTNKSTTSDNLPSVMDNIMNSNDYKVISGYINLEKICIFMAGAAAMKIVPAIYNTVYNVYNIAKARVANFRPH